MLSLVTLKTDVVERLGIPGIHYPIDLEFALRNEGNIAPEMLLSWIQTYTDDSEDWKIYREASLALSRSLAPELPEPILEAESDEWFVEIGPLDLSLETATIQKQGELILAIQNRGDGRLRTCFYEPPSKDVLHSLLLLSIHPTETGYVYHDTSNWAAAVNYSGTTSALYADEQGQHYRSYWKYGIGLLGPNEVDPRWVEQAKKDPIPPNLAMAMLAVYHEFHS
jgi:hypothetical protein